ncbi:Box C D snoRNA 1 [Paramuricea clavata]|uniref:Box C D snoRNA 1 n=1 Tax=Paramuricea clavata TaxID=317549 RepID=A0A6S7J8L4_PARCT|nr:Box C D snoRNA 1 [Paramuricea clavata]
MPVGFQARLENTSCFHFKTKAILWRIKWEFPQANTHYVEAKVSESKSIKSLLEKYLHPTHADPVFKQRLKGFIVNARLPDGVQTLMCQQERVI